MLNYKDVEAMEPKAILTKIGELRGEVFSLRMQKRTTGLEKPHLMKQAKKDIARLLTAYTKKARSAK